MASSKKKGKIGDITHSFKADIHPNYNNALTAILQEIAINEKNSGERYKFRAYSKAIQSLKAHSKKITSGSEAKKLPGIGQKIAKKIQEILETGKLTKLEEANADERVQSINLVSRVYGIGPVAARKFVDVDGVTTLEDLAKLKDKLSAQHLLGLKYFEDFEKRIPRDEMQKLESVIKEVVTQIDKDIKMETCGSYRRGAETSGDIDILMTHPKYTIDKKGNDHLHSMDQLVSKLKKKKFLIDDLSFGPLKYMGVCRLGDNSTARRIDIKLVPIESYYYGIMHSTGSDEYNRQLRLIALDRGFSLSEYGLYPIGETGVKGDPISASSEEEICELLQTSYTPPEFRSI